MDDPSRLEEISAAVDGEAPLPADLSPDEVAFHDAALRLRSALGLLDPTPAPDVVPVVVERVGRTGRPRRRTWVAAAAVFVTAALAAGLALRPGGPAAPGIAAADMTDEILGAQRSLAAFDASVVLIERGVHPDIAVRRLSGALRYRAPETLWLQLRETDPRSPAWPANDIELLVDEGVVWRHGLVDCPVGAQPDCLRPADRVVTDLVPFAESAVSPLDLVVPVDAFLPAVDTHVREAGDRLVVEATVARLDRLVEGLRSAGAIRSVHPTDAATLELDAGTLTLRRLTISAADNLARSTWAATNGYRDVPGDVVLDLRVDPADLPDVTPPEPPETTDDTRSGGFRHAEIPVDWPLPEGFSVHRTGRLDSGGPASDVVALSDGRAWIRVESTEEWDGSRPFGGLGPLAREIPVGTGVGYVDPAGTKVSVHTPDRDLVVTGSVARRELVELAGAILTGVALDPSWDPPVTASRLPAGALVPPGDHLATVTGGRVLVDVPAPGRSGVVLTQRPAVTLPPPRADIVGAEARGQPARYSPGLGTLTWLEDGWMRELSAPGHDLAALEAIAAELETP